MRKHVVAAVAGVALFGGGTAQAALVSVGSEEPVVASSENDVIVTFGGAVAAYENDLFLVTDDGIDDNDVFIFNNRAAVGTEVNLGPVAAGSELLFRLFVNDTGDNFFTGNAWRNADLFAHAAMQVAGSITTIGFEDLTGGGDNDFDDLVFTVEQADAVTPIPAAGVLLVTGFAGLAGLARRKRRTA
jgi:hypothetical protein